MQSAGWKKLNSMRLGPMSGYHNLGMRASTEHESVEKRTRQKGVGARKFVAVNYVKLDGVMQAQARPDDAVYDIT
jgi:hypothetical protein